MRKGMMVGTGKKGYHNVVGRDPAVHSQSSKGIKQPQNINIISPNALPIYKIGGQFYFRDERLGEYRNIKNPSDRKRIDDVNNSELQKWTKRDSDFIFGKEQLSPEDIKGLSSWVSDYKKAIHYQNIKLAKQIRDNIVKVLKEKGVEEPYKHEIWGKSNEWEDHPDYNADNPQLERWKKAYNIQSEKKWIDTSQYGYDKLKTGDRIELNGRKGVLLSDSKYQSSTSYGAFFGKVKFDDGEIADKMLNYTGAKVEVSQ